jgi:hypothetical protein
MRTILLVAFAASLLLIARAAGAETPVCGQGNLPLTTVGGNSGFEPYVTVDPSPATSGDPSTFLIGATSYIAGGASATVDGNTISLTLTASYLGIGVPPPPTCSAATLDALAAGTYAVNVYLNTTNDPATTAPALVATGSLVVADGDAVPSENVPITAGFTGAWYDPNQAGHGIFIEVLSDRRMLAWWFTFSFDPTDSKQVWFGGDGPINGNNTAVLNVLQTLGGQWIPNFDPTAIHQQPWGMLTFSFTDCNHGRVDFTSVVGYGSGHMDLTRLTQPAGLTCP